MGPADKFVLSNEPSRFVLMRDYASASGGAGTAGDDSPTNMLAILRVIRIIPQPVAGDA